MSLTKEFDAKKSTPQMLSPTAYQALLEQLVTTGAGLGKTQNVGAFLMRDINIVTETRLGEVETSKNIKVEPAYVLLDIEHYPLEHQRGLVIKDTAKNWAGKVIRERDLDSPDFQGPGIWLNKQNAVEFDYIPVDASDVKNSERKPNPEAYRVCLPVATPVNVPVQWEGGFFIASGGTLAIRERDIQGLAVALKSIRDGKATAAEALYSAPDVAKFDIYGMEPGFAEKQYGSVPLKAETLALQTVASPAGLKILPMPKKLG
jgi:hypothetical protein